MQAYSLGFSVTPGIPSDINWALFRLHEMPLRTVEQVQSEKCGLLPRGDAKGDGGFPHEQLFKRLFNTFVLSEFYLPTESDFNEV